MNQEILMQLVYCSHNCMVGEPADVHRQVMAMVKNCRVNNARHGITGALLFDGNAFAQVLEGPIFAVEELFEQLIFDSRHRDITLLISGGIVARQFPNSPMAFAGLECTANTAEAVNALHSAFVSPFHAAAPVVSLLQRLIAEKEEWRRIDSRRNSASFQPRLVS